MANLLKYFSFQGRANRQPYWMTNLALVGIVFVCAVIVGVVAAASPVLAIFAVPVIVGYFWVGMANAARRLHDRNKSAWWLLLFWGAPMFLGLLQGAAQGAGGASGETVAPVFSLLSLPIAVWVFVELGCLRGTVGPNRFGDDPLQPALQEVFA